jgi:hypothetical protein
MRPLVTLVIFNLVQKSPKTPFGLKLYGLKNKNIRQNSF